MGLAKKVILADVLDESDDKIFTFTMEAATIPTSMTWFGAVAYTFDYETPKTLF